jgi:hypothetical protein
MDIKSKNITVWYRNLCSIFYQLKKVIAILKSTSVCVERSFNKTADRDFSWHEKRVQKPLRSIGRWNSFLINLALFCNMYDAYQKKTAMKYENM